MARRGHLGLDGRVVPRSALRRAVRRQRAGPGAGGLWRQPERGPLLELARAAAAGQRAAGNSGVSFGLPVGPGPKRPHGELGAQPEPGNLADSLVEHFVDVTGVSICALAACGVVPCGGENLICHTFCPPPVGASGFFTFSCLWQRWPWWGACLPCRCWTRPALPHRRWKTASRG